MFVVDWCCHFERATLHGVAVAWCNSPVFGDFSRLALQKLGWKEDTGIEPVERWGTVLVQTKSAVMTKRDLAPTTFTWIEVKVANAMKSLNAMKKRSV